MFRPSKFFGLFSRRSGSGRLRRPSLDGAEPLERRSMLSATFDTGTGVLTLVGTAARDTIILNAVRQNGVVVNGSVRVRGVADVATGQVFQNVSSVVISTGTGHDRVTIAPGIRNASGGLLAVTVEAGNGNDIVNGGDGDDTILGGSGKDNLRGGRGDDSIDGNDDNDQVSGDDGDDVLLGGRGKDNMRGGRGDDSMYGGDDQDRLLGNEGDDDLDGEDDDDYLEGGEGNDDDVDDDDSLDDMSASGDDSGDNENEDEDENEDADDDDGDFEDEDEDEGDDGDGEAEDNDDPVGTPIAFVSGAASVTGTSDNKQDKRFYSFTVASDSTLSVTMLNVDNGRYPDLEVERQGTGVEVEYDLEPSDSGTTTGSFFLPAGTYSLRLRSSDLLAVSYSIDLMLS